MMEFNKEQNQHVLASVFNNIENSNLYKVEENGDCFYFKNNEWVLIARSFEFKEIEKNGIIERTIKFRPSTPIKRIKKDFSFNFGG